MTSSTETIIKKRICVGKIASAHGIKGLVKIFPYCEDTNLLNGKVFIEESGNKTLDITLKNPIGKYILAEIDQIITREQAETLKHSLYVSREVLPAINNDDEFYIEDLIGLKAQTSDGESIGKILGVQNFGAGDLFEITPNAGETFFVPVQEEYAPEINPKDGYIAFQNYRQFIIE